MRADPRRGLRGYLWRVARLLARRGQGHAARQGDLRTAIAAAREPLPPRETCPPSAAQPAQAETPSRFLASSRRAAFLILPDSVIGKTSTNTTCRGSLKLAILPRQWPTTSSASIVAPPPAPAEAQGTPAA